MTEHIGIRVALKPLVMGNLHAAENEGEAFLVAVDVVANAGAGHDQRYSLKSTFPFVAQMKSLPSWVLLGCSRKSPPAACNNSLPAAMSHSLSCSSP